MYSKVGAKDADLLVIGKKRISRKRKFFICLLFAATVLSGMSVIEKLNAPAPTPVDTSVKIVASMPKPASGSPVDYSAYENFCIAAGVINESSYFQADTQGTIVASVFGAPYNQTLEGHRVSKNGRLFHEINSTSTMKSVGEQRFFAQDTILMRTAKYKKGVPQWGSIGLVQVDDFSAKYGLIPREICLYVVNESTVLESGFVSEENGLSTYYLVLDPNDAPERYKRQVGALGGASDYPVFKSIKLTFTVDSDWNIQSHTVEETYDISIAGLGSMTCRATMTETFTNINADLEFPDAAQDFINLAPGDVGNLDPDNNMTAADYLAEAFGGYLGGDAIKFAADINAFGLSLPLKGYLDIKNLDVRIGVGDILYAAYGNDCVYIKSGDGKIKIPTASLMPVIDELKPMLESAGIDLNQISSLLEGDIIGTLFADSDIIEDGNDVHILMPFSLMNIGFDIDMHLFKVGEKFMPKAIKANLDLKELGLDKFIKTEDGSYKVAVDLKFTDEVLAAPDESFVEFDASFIKEFIAPVKSLVSAKSYELGGNVTVGKTEIGIDAKIIPEKDGVTLAATLEVMGIKADVKLVNNEIYISAGNIKLKAAISDLPQLIDEVITLIPNGDEIIAAVNGLKDAAKNISAEKVLESVFKFLPTLKFSDGVLSAEISGVKADVTIESANEISVSLPSLTVKDTAVSAKLGVKAVAEKLPSVVVSDTDEYVSVKDLVPYLAPIKSLIASTSFKVTLGGSVSGFDTEKSTKALEFNGNMTLNLKDGEQRALSMQGAFNALSQELSFALIGNKAYIALGDGIKLSLDIDGESLRKLLAAVNDALPQENKLGETTVQTAISAINAVSGLDIKSLFSLIKFDETTIAKTLGYVRKLEYKDDALTLTLSFGDVTVTLNLIKPKDGAALTVTAAVDFTPASEEGQAPKAPVNAQISLTFSDFSDKSVPIAVDTENYVSSETLCSFVSPIVNAAFANAYTFGGEIDVNGTKIQLVSAQLVRAESISLKAQIRVMGVTADVRFVDNVVYISAGNIHLKVALGDLPQLTDEIVALIPNGDELLGTVNGLIEKIKNTDILGAIKALKISETQDGGLGISYGDISAKIKAEADDKLSLALSDLKFEIGTEADENGERIPKLLTLNANVNLTAVREQTPPVTVDDEDKYVSVKDLVPYIAPIKTLLTSESFKAALSGTIESNDIKKYLSSTQLGGNLAINIGKENGGLSLQAALTAFGHNVDLAFVNSTAYVSINDLINLSLNTNNLGDILSSINETLSDGKKIDVDKVNDSVNKITSFDLSSLIKFDENTIAKVLGYIRKLEYKDGSLTAVLSFNDVTVTASIVSPESGAESLDMNLSVNYAPKAKPNEKPKDPLDVNLALTLSDFSSERVNIVVANPEKYVASKTIADFIKPVINTIKQEKFDIAYGVRIDGKDKSGKTETTFVSGVIKVIPTSEITNASFPEMYLELNIGSQQNETEREHKIKLLIEKTAATGEIEIYANYNGMKVHLGYTAALKIVGAVCDMMKIDIPMINNLTNGIYKKGELQTDIFDDATIAGLTEKIKDLNGIFAAAEGGKSAFDELINKVLYNALDEALRSVSLSMPDGELQISVNNSLLERIMEIVNGKDETQKSETTQTPAVKPDLGKAAISLKHDGTLLSSLDLSNLAVNGKTVGMNVTLNDSANMTLPESTDNDFNSAMDFDSIYDLLASVINTANTRYFPISGTIDLNAISLAKVKISFDLNVAIVDNPKYDPNAKAPENDPNYKPEPKTKVLVGLKIWNGLSPRADDVIERQVITKTDSYLYFDGDDLYVQRDDYKREYSWKDVRYYWVYEKTTRYKMTPKEFTENAMDVIFDLIPLTEKIQKQITDSMSGNSTDKAPMNYANILTGYGKTGNTFSLKLNLAELAGTSVLGDLNLTLNEKNIDGKNYLQSFGGDTKILSIVSGTFDAKLKSIDENNLTRGLDPIEFGYDNGQKQSSVQYTELVNRLNSLSWQTVQDAHK